MGGVMMAQMAAECLGLILEETGPLVLCEHENAKAELE